MTEGSPVSIERMMIEPYSTLRSIGISLAGSSNSRDSVSQSAIWLTQRRGYSSSGML